MVAFTPKVPLGMFLTSGFLGLGFIFVGVCLGVSELFGGKILGFGDGSGELFSYFSIHPSEDKGKSMENTLDG